MQSYLLGALSWTILISLGSTYLHSNIVSKGYSNRISITSHYASSSAVESHGIDDVIVIGSGLGGLSCAAVLASKGYKVSVHEAHYEIGGCAHEFFYDESGKNIPSELLSKESNNNVYKFEAGPSLYSGLSPSHSPNPLKHVFQIINEEPEWVQYKVWKAFLPEAPDGFLSSIGAEEFVAILRRYGGPTAVSDWERLSSNLRPLAEGVMKFPSIAIRPGLSAIRTTLLRYPKAIVSILKQAKNLTKPFSEYYKELNITDEFLKNYLNLLCFLLQGLPAEGTLSAVMAYMVEDFFRPNAVMDFPKGGSGAIAAALERGILKHGGNVYRRSPIKEIIVTDGKASGVRLKDGSIAKAKAVVSNCDLWTTTQLVAPGASAAFDIERDNFVKNAPMCNSFMHLHLGIDAQDLPADMPPQWTVCQDWSQPIDAPGNVIVVSVPSVLDPTLAPPGRHVIHAYTAGNEPYELWEKFKGLKNSPEYEALRKERSQCLWDAIAREIPDIRNRVKVELVGTPLTHERFNRRYRGTYGPAFAAGAATTFPGQKTPIPGLYRCGDSVNPGIGVPAVAASGAMAAACILSTREHIDILNKIKM